MSSCYNIHFCLFRATDSTPSEADHISPNFTALLQTMITISSDPMSFFTGELAEDIVADIQEAGASAVILIRIRRGTTIRYFNFWSVIDNEETNVEMDN